MYFPRSAFLIAILAIGILVTNANVLASNQKITIAVDAEGTLIGQSSQAVFTTVGIARQSKAAQQDPVGVIQVGEPVIDEDNSVGDDDDGEGDFGGDGDGGGNDDDDDNDVLDDDNGSGDICKDKPSKGVQTTPASIGNLVQGKKHGLQRTVNSAGKRKKFTEA